MALETRIPKEITDYREKIFAGFSGRQLISIAAALAVVGVTAFVLWGLLGINFSVVEYILIFEALPFVAFGFIRHKGMTFEQVVRIRSAHVLGSKRLLKQNNLDYLPSLYPLIAHSKSEGANRNEVLTRKEKRARKRQREYLTQTKRTRKRRSRAERKAAHKKA